MGQKNKNKPTNPETEELRAKLRSKIGESRIQRSRKQNKEQILEKSLKNMGIDHDKLKKDLESIKKQGGLELKYNN